VKIEDFCRILERDLGIILIIDIKGNLKNVECSLLTCVCVSIAKFWCYSFVPCVFQGVPFWNRDAYCGYCYYCYVIFRCCLLSQTFSFRIMYDVPSTAVFCSESAECFFDTAYKVFLKPLVTISVAPIKLLLV
jgi:hypothetical protein